ncbi:MAG: NTP transferase domain-containing protein [Rhodospirillales bacterium]
MIAVMLAAGVGRRLFGENHAEPPKALLRFDGKSLLHRHIEILRENGVERLVLVVGYRAEELMAEVEAAGAGDYVRAITNPEFEGGPVISLWTAREVLRGGDDILFMDADVLYHRRVLERLIRSPHANCFLLDRGLEPGEDPVHLCIQDGAPVDFGKNIEGSFDLVGEWPGFMRMSPAIAARVADAAEAIMEAGRSDVTYEVAMRDVVLSEPPGTFAYEDITGLPWIEIDYPSDLLRAERTILPQVSRAATEDEKADTDVA